VELKLAARLVHKTSGISFESNQSGIETALEVCGGVEWGGLNRTRVELKHVGSQVEFCQSLWFESNQSGIETIEEASEYFGVVVRLNRTRVELKPNFQSLVRGNLAV